VKIDIARVTRSGDGFPADEIEKSVRRLVVILDAYGVGLGYDDDFGHNWEEGAKRLLGQAVMETDRLAAKLRLAASRLGLEYQGWQRDPLSSPDPQQRSDPHPETPISIDG